MHRSLTYPSRSTILNSSSACGEYAIKASELFSRQASSKSTYWSMISNLAILSSNETDFLDPPLLLAIVIVERVAREPYVSFVKILRMPTFSRMTVQNFSENVTNYD